MRVKYKVWLENPWDHIKEGTNVKLTFVHAIFFLETNVCPQDKLYIFAAIFVTQNFHFASISYGIRIFSKIFWTHFFIQNSFNPTIFDTKYLGPNLFNQKYFMENNLFWTLHVFGPTYIRTYKTFRNLENQILEVI